MQKKKAIKKATPHKKSVRKHMPDHDDENTQENYLEKDADLEEENGEPEEDEETEHNIGDEEISGSKALEIPNLPLHSNDDSDASKDDEISGSKALDIPNLPPHVDDEEISGSKALDIPNLPLHVKQALKQANENAKQKRIADAKKQPKS